MKLRVLATTAALAATGSVLVTAPALAGLSSGPSGHAFVPYSGWPSGATASVTTEMNPHGRSLVTLQVAGLDPHRTYGAHAHVASCSTPSGAGGHWQRVPGPLGDPRYSNPGNELWLDVTTDGTGAGTSRGTQDFSSSSTGRPKSVIIHAEPTATGRPDAGRAGARLACISVDF